MIAVVQRVLSASVSVAGETAVAIDHGLVVFVAAQKRDTPLDCAWIAGRIAGLRVFEDGEGKMNLSCSDVGGKLLVVSNFTVAADTRKGRRPSFDKAAPFDDGKVLFLEFLEQLRKFAIEVETGVYGEEMFVTSTNNGPITLIVESPE